MIIKSEIKNYSITFNVNLNKNFSNIKNKFYIIDKKVADLYKFKFLNKKNTLIINSSESQKQYSSIEKFLLYLIKSKVNKETTLVAIGGGVVQDITSFMAMTYFRGIKWIFVPTTLISQADSCIGSKVAINLKNYKNSIGGYYPPNRIFLNTDFINSLSNKHLKSGIGEMAHYFFLDNKSNYKIFENFLYNFDYKNLIVLNKIIKICLNIKKKFIERDEFEKNERLLLNYGHTMGHAIETYSNFTIPHGVAVSYGMNFENFVSFKMKYINFNQYYEYKNLLKIVYKNYSFQYDATKLLKIILADKKNSKNIIKLILTKGIGDMFIKKFNEKQINTFLKEYQNEE